MANKQQILLIRMQHLSDVAAIGIPALRYYQQKYPDADFTFLTYGQGEQLIKLAEPNVTIAALAQDQWPDNILPAMETFLGLAEEIVGIGYEQIINLDTSFMPCFLARFLKDAGENVTGNIMSVSVQELIEQFQSQQLKPEYVTQAKNYLDSTFFTMATWHSQWWNGANIPDGGYPEYYLSRACGLGDINMDRTIKLPAISKGIKSVIALATSITDVDDGYPYTKQLEWALEQAGYETLIVADANQDVKLQLEQLHKADLLVTLPRDAFWLATCVNTPRLVLCGDTEPRVLMSDYTIEEVNLEDITPEAIVDMVKHILNDE